LGDAISIGVSFFLERKSKNQPDETYTYGYARYSVIGGVVTTLILLLGSITVIYNAILRIINPTPINYNGMILLAVIGLVVNLAAAFFTKDGHSINQKAVNLHMLEDVLGWIVVLVGATVMHFTDFALIDPIMSIGVALFILINVVKNLKEVLDLFLEKTPHGIDVYEIKKHISEIDGIINVHHIHVWSIDGLHNYATMHIVTNANSQEIKEKIRKELKEYGIGHSTMELESEGEFCHEQHCHMEATLCGYQHHHH
jgi:cobalt-zinc-cadmium efflux system protein